MKNQPTLKAEIPEKLLEKLASAAHDCWSEWAEYFIDNATEERVAKWEEQILTNYEDLGADDQLKDKQIIAEYYGDIIAQELAQVEANVIERERERVLSELDIVWVCPPCAKKFFDKNYTEGKTNVYTAVHRKCEACHQYNQCMHHRSYDD